MHKIGNRVLVSIQNTNSSVSKFIRRFDIIASSVTVKKDTNKSIIIKNIDTEKIYDYIFNKENGDYLANILAWYYKYSDFTYKIISKTDYALNSLVEISDSGIGTNIARIIYKKYVESLNRIEYELEAVDEYIPDVVTNEHHSSSGNIIKLNIEASPAYTLNASSNVVKIYKDGTFQPSSVEFNSFSNTNTNGMVPYLGIFKYYVNDVLQSYSTIPTSSVSWNGFTVIPNDSLYPSDYLIPGYEFIDSPEDIESIKIELWTDDNSVKLDSRNLTIIKDIEFTLPEIINETSNNLPKYIGTYLSNYPTIYNNGDWFILYNTDDVPNQRGIYKVKSDLTFTRITGSDITDAAYISSVMPDILSIVNTGLYGAIADYGDITYITNLATNSVFTNSLRVGTNNLDTTLIQDGKIKTNMLNAQEIVSGAGYFEGTVNALDGVFRGSISSGPLALNLGAPSSYTITTTSKLLNAFVEELITNNINPSTYATVGTYNSNNIDSITITKSTSKQDYSYFTSKDYTFSHSYTSPMGITTFYYSLVTKEWEQYKTVTTYTLTGYYNGTQMFTSTGTTWPVGYWVKIGESTSAYSTTSPTMTDIADPTGTVAAGNTCPTLLTGSFSFNAGTYTLKLVNLPIYSSGMDQWTGYLEADEDGNYYLKIKGN